MKQLSLIFALMLPILAQAASVSSGVSSDHVAVGQPFHFQIRVDGTTNVILPDDLGLEDFQTLGTNRSTQVQIINGRMSTVFVKNYTLMALEEGDLEIPPIEVTMDGKKESTQAHSLKVTQGTLPQQRGLPGQSAIGGGSQQAPGQPPADGHGPAADAELIVPKKSIYVGELVPVEVRFYFNDAYTFRQNERDPTPRFSGEGFTVADLKQGEITQQTIDGVNYTVLPFKTAVTAVKSGQLEIPPVTLSVLMEVPTEAPQGMDSVFDQFFGGRLRETREVEVRSDPVTIDVESLPREGKPADFSGAIGEFTAAATADPEKAGPGEPITLGISISGRGNFDSMAPPSLSGTGGWKTYPATDQFEASDKVGYSGTKTYSFPIVAKAEKTETPVAEFSFFNPATGKYESIRTQPVAVNAAASGAAESEGESEEPASPDATPAPKGDSEGWLVESRNRDFEPLLTNRIFWMANGAAGALLLLAIGVSIVRRSQSGPAAHRRERVHRRDRIIRDLRSQDGSEFLVNSVRAMDLQAELSGEPDARSWIRSNPESRDELRSVLDRADEIEFGGGVAVAVSPEERQRIIAALGKECR